MRSRRITPRYGVLLPHFGAPASRAVLAAARQAEAAGFDSVWVRDHLVYAPHGFEDQDRTFLEALTVLAAVASITERVQLATGALTPHRHPLLLASILASLEALAPGRVTLGIGLGNDDREFEAAGMKGWDRREVVREQVAILRRLWSGEVVSHRGRYYDFNDVSVLPVPTAPIPVWYCGNSRAAMRRAIEFCDGWIAGRLPLHVFQDRIQFVAAASASRREQPLAGIIPLVMPATTHAEVERRIDLGALLQRAARYPLPPSGRLESVQDLNGAAIVGSPALIAEGVMRFVELGVSHFVFDLRASFDDWERHVDLIGSRVLPELWVAEPTRLNR